jgi:hypothetical protein
VGGPGRDQSDCSRGKCRSGFGDHDVALVRPALRVAALPDSWKEYFGERRERTRTRAADLTAKIFQTC